MTGHRPLPALARFPGDVVGRALKRMRAGATRARGRHVRASRLPASPKDVLFVSGSGGASTRYRCDHRAEELGLHGVSSDVALLPDVHLDSAVDLYGCFVLHRVRFESSVGRFIERAHAAGKHVIFDTDDLVFDSSVERHVPRRARREHGVRRQRETLVRCDAVTVATAPLAERAAGLHGRVLIEPNTVSSQMLALADTAFGRSAAGGRTEDVCIAYLSGTSTHDVDFLEAADAVLWALGTYPSARFTAIGPLRLDSRFDLFGKRVERISKVPWEALPDLLAGISVNLAPLERGNGFSECKSSIKYLEAALLHVPTIASPRPDFARSIEHGVNGLLADSPAEWQEALSTLVRSGETRARVGQAAYEDVHLNHSTANLARATFETFRSITGGPTDDRPPGASAAPDGAPGDRA